MLGIFTFKYFELNVLSLILADNLTGQDGLALHHVFYFSLLEL